MRTLNVPLSEQQYEDLVAAKHGRTWREAMLEDMVGKHPEEYNE